MFRLWCKIFDSASIDGSHRLHTCRFCLNHNICLILWGPLFLDLCCCSWQYRWSCCRLIDRLILAIWIDDRLECIRHGWIALPYLTQFWQSHAMVDARIRAISDLARSLLSADHSVSKDSFDVSAAWYPPTFRRPWLRDRWRLPGWLTILFPPVLSPAVDLSNQIPFIPFRFWGCRYTYITGQATVMVQLCDNPLVPIDCLTHSMPL